MDQPPTGRPKAPLPALEARVRRIVDRSTRPTKVVAFAELTIADAFIIKGIRVLQREDPPHEKPFVIFPAERRINAKTDRWYDIAHPATSEARAAAVAVILAAYENAEAAGA